MEKQRNVSRITAKTGSHMMEARVKQIFGPRSFDPAGGWKWWSSLLAAVVIYVLASVVGIIIMVVPLIGGATEAQLAAGQLPVPSGPIVVGALVASQLLVILALMWAGRRKASGWTEGLHMVPVRTSGRWLTAIVLVSLALPAADLIFGLAFPEPLKADGQWIEALLRDPDTWLATLIMVTAGAALSEEMLFRGFLLPAFANTRLGFWGAAVVTTSLWTLIHAYSWQGSFLIALTGLVLCYALWRTGSIIPGIVLHALMNGICAVLTLAG